MKLLLVAPMALPFGPVGGMGSVTENMVHFLEKNQDGIDFTHYNTVHKVRPLSTRSLFIRVFTGIFNSLKTYARVLSLIKRERPELIHLASSASFALVKDYLIVRLAHRKKIPIVLHWHFGRTPALAAKQNWEWKVLKHVVPKSTVSIVIDKSSCDTFHQAGFSNVVYIPNPVAPDVAQKAAESRANPVQRQNNRIIYVGHVIKTKGVCELVQACAQLPLNIELTLIGSYTGDIKDELQALAEAKQEGKWPCFAGQLKKDQVLDCMLQSPILVLPSYTEGFPMVIIEAMAMGCAIIATDVGAIPEILAVEGDAPCGICVPARQVEKLGDAISALEKDPVLTAEMGKRGKERVLNCYNAETVMNQYVGVWNAVLEKNRRPIGAEWL